MPIPHLNSGPAYTREGYFGFLQHMPQELQGSCYQLSDFHPVTGQPLPRWSPQSGCQNAWKENVPCTTTTLPQCCAKGCAFAQ